MRITIIAPGSRGDIQPYIALGQGLRDAGHGVSVVTNGEFEPLVRSYGLECRPVAMEAQRAFQEDKTRAAIEGGSIATSFIQLARLARRMMFALAETGRDAARGGDAVLAGFSGLFMGAAIAEALGQRLIQAYNVPVTPTRSFPGALVPAFPLGPRSLTYPLSHRATRQVLWQASRAAGNKARVKALGLRSAPVLGAFGDGALAEGPVLYGFSPSVIARPADWDGAVEVTGYWFTDEPRDWAPPAGLEEFLRGGPPPVYMGFGSMSHRDPEKTTGLAREALRLTGQRAVVVTGWGGMGGKERHEDIYVADSVPHSWLFPRVSAVVHHGGAGTTGAGIRAGVPSIIIPFHGDQPFWGRRVAELGVGPAPLPRRHLGAAGLARAIEQALGDAGMRERAAALGARVRSEDGVARAVEAIGRLKG